MEGAESGLGGGAGEEGGGCWDGLGGVKVGLGGVRGGGEGCEGEEGWVRAVWSLGRRVSGFEGMGVRVTYVHGGGCVEGSV